GVSDVPASAGGLEAAEGPWPPFQVRGKTASNARRASSPAPAWARGRRLSPGTVAAITPASHAIVSQPQALARRCTSFGDRDDRFSDSISQPAARSAAVLTALKPIRYRGLNQPRRRRWLAKNRKVAYSAGHTTALASAYPRTTKSQVGRD